MKRKPAGCLRWGCIIAGVPLALMVLAAAYFAVDNTRLPTASLVTARLSDLDQARLEEALRLKAELGDEVFEGWAGAPLAQVIYNEQYAFLVAYPLEEGLPPDGWQVVPGGTRRGGAWEITPEDDYLGEPYARVKLASQNETPQAFVVRVGEVPAGSMTTYDWSKIGLSAQVLSDLPAFLRPIFPSRIMTSLLLGDTDKYISLILHENAHAFQEHMAPQRLAASEQANYAYEDAYPVKDKAFVDAWQAELDLLARALRAPDDAEARSLAAQFIEQRRARRADADLSPELVDFERQREWLEGIARYAEITIYRLAFTTPGYMPVEALSADADFHAYKGFEARWSQEIDQLTRMAGSDGEGRFYYTGMAQAVLLDRLAPGWKAQLFDENIWLEDLLASAVGK